MTSLTAEDRWSQSLRQVYLRPGEMENRTGMGAGQLRRRRRHEAKQRLTQDIAISNAGRGRQPEPCRTTRPSVASRPLVLYSRRERDRGKREWQRRGRWSGRMGARRCIPPPARSDGRTSASAMGGGSIRFTRRPGSAAPNRSIRPCSATSAATGPASPSAGPTAPADGLPDRWAAAAATPPGGKDAPLVASDALLHGYSSNTDWRLVSQSAEALVIAVDYPEDSPVAGMTAHRAPGRR